MQELLRSQLEDLVVLQRSLELAQYYANPADVEFVFVSGDLAQLLHKALVEVDQTFYLFSHARLIALIMCIESLYFCLQLKIFPCGQLAYKSKLLLAKTYCDKCYVTPPLNDLVSLGTINRYHVYDAPVL